MDLLTVVIPVHGRWDLTRGCLESLAAHTPGAFWRVVVADGASPDATARECGPLLAALFGPRGEHRRAARRLSFAEACNLGARGAASEFLFFLNNDTRLAPGWLDPLVTSLRREPGVGAVAPLLLYPGDRAAAPESGGAWAAPVPACLAGRVQHAGVVVDTNKHPQHLFHAFPAGHPAVRRPRRLQALSGAALMLPRGLFEALGGFCEEFVNGSEDLDLCARLRRTGRQCLFEPRSVFFHLGAATPGRYDRLGRNARLLDARCRNAFLPDLHVWAEREGFALRLNEWLEPGLAEREEPETTAEREPRPLSELEADLERHPLRESGYAELARHLRQRGDATGEARVRGLRAMLLPGIASFSEALDACRKAGDQPGTEYWGLRLSEARRHLRESPEPAFRARREAEHYRKQGRERLARPYRNWLAVFEGDGK